MGFLLLSFVVNHLPELPKMDWEKPFYGEASPPFL